jgi:hypothetical protein
MGTFILVVIVIALLIGIALFLYYFPLGLWIRTVAAGVPLSIISLIRMRIIGVPAGLLVANLVRARKAGLPLTVDQLQSHILAGGNIDKVTLAMIAAQRAQIPLEWQRAAAIDLAGRDVLDALQTSVNPKVIETPLFQGVAQNGIQLNVKARITVRSNLDRYVGGAGEPTIVARVGEGVVSAVGAAVDHKEVLEFPDRRRRRRPQHRRRPPDVASGSRPQDRASEGRRAAVRRDRRGARAESADAADARQGRRSRGADPASDRRGVPRGASGRDGLLQAQQREGRHRDARRDRVERR